MFIISAPSGARPSRAWSRSIQKERGSMREMEWPTARGGAGLLTDGRRLTARRLDGLGQTLISGDLVAAVAGLAPGAPMLGLYALAPAGAHALRIGRTSALLVTPAPLGVVDGWRDGWCATSVDDGLGRGRDLRRRRSAGAHAGDLGRPRLGIALGGCPSLWPARPARADVLRLPRPHRSRRGSRRCSPGWMGSDEQRRVRDAFVTACP